MVPMGGDGACLQISALVYDNLFVLCYWNILSFVQRSGLSKSRQNGWMDFQDPFLFRDDVPLQQKVMVIKIGLKSGVLAHVFDLSI